MLETKIINVLNEQRKSRIKNDIIKFNTMSLTEIGIIRQRFEMYFLNFKKLLALRMFLPKR